MSVQYYARTPEWILENMRRYTYPLIIVFFLYLIPFSTWAENRYTLTSNGLIPYEIREKQEEYVGKNITQKHFLRLQNVWKLRPTYDISSEIYPKIQDYKLSCEIAALEIIFRYLGFVIEEDIIIWKLPIYNVPYNTGSGIWGDPDKEFVGSLTGSQRGMTGYGVYAEPLREIATIYGFVWEAYEGIRSGMTEKYELTHKLQELKKWHGIILWWDWCTLEEYDDGLILLGESWLRFFPIAWKNTCNRDEKDRIMKWKTEDGKNIFWISGEHAFVLLGYVGTLENPSHIIVWDTDTGRHIYPTEEWIRKWRLLNYRSLIIKK